MHTYQATVRVGGLITQVQVVAQNFNFALAQLKALYGENNVIHLPQQIN